MILKLIFSILLSILTISDLAHAQAGGKNTGLLCPTPDTDCDGYTTDGTLEGYDCNDSDWQQYPGIWRYSGGYYSKCNTDGTWSTGTLTPNDASGSGANYFIDCSQATNGTGSFASPWNTLKMVSSLAWSAPPAGWHNPVAGDAIWIAGECTELIDRDGVPGGESYTYFLLYRDGTNTNHIKFNAWPGKTRGKINQSNATEIAFATLIEGSDYVDFHGLEVTGNATYGIYFAEANHGTFRNLYIHHMDGTAFDNNAGFTLGSSDNSEVTHSVFMNNYDVENPGNQNNRNMVFFQGTANKVKYNVFDNTDAAALASTSNKGFGYKHGDKVTRNNASFEFSYNIVKNSDTGFETGQAGSWIHHNYIEARTEGISFKDNGGPTFINNELTEYNTIKAPITISTVNDGYSFLFSSITYSDYANFGAFPGTGAANTIYRDVANNNRWRWTGTEYQSLYNAYISYANLAAFPGTGVLGTIYIAADTGTYYKWNGSTYANAKNIVRKNVLRTNEASFNSEKGIIADTVYGSNLIYDIYSKAGQIDYSENCYFNAGIATLVWNHFNAAGGYGNKGAQYFFTGWQATDTTGSNAKPAWDDDSFVENPVFNAISLATSTNCANKGYLAGLTGGGSPIISPTPTATPSPSGSLVPRGDFRRRKQYNPFEY